jgi:hypothetical protein
LLPLTVSDSEMDKRILLRLDAAAE